MGERKEELLENSPVVVRGRGIQEKRCTWLGGTPHEAGNVAWLTLNEASAGGKSDILYKLVEEEGHGEKQEEASWKGVVAVPACVLAPTSRQ